MDSSIDADTLGHSISLLNEPNKAAIQPIMLPFLLSVPGNAVKQLGSLVGLGQSETPAQICTIQFGQVTPRTAGHLFACFRDGKLRWFSVCLLVLLAES